MTALSGTHVFLYFLILVMLFWIYVLSRMLISSGDKNSKLRHDIACRDDRIAWYIEQLDLQEEIADAYRVKSAELEDIVGSFGKDI